MVDDNQDDDASPRPGRPRRSRPFWRKGWFWVGVIAAEIAVVLVLSFALERSTTEVDLSGGDLAAFCDLATTVRDQGTATDPSGATQGGSVGDPTRFEQERDAYLALIATAPPALVADLERLAELDDEIIVAVREIGEKKAADPSYSGIADLTAALERAQAEGRVAAARVNLVLREQCGFQPTSGVTTTVAATPAVPGSTPAVPGSTPS